jgi:hypothetical protein
MHTTKPEVREPNVSVSFTGNSYYRLPPDVRETMDSFIDRRSGTTGQLSFLIPARRYREIELILKRLSVNHSVAG